MNSNSSSMTSSKGDSPWSEHALRITTPEYKYIRDGGKSIDEESEHTGPPLPRIYHSTSMVSSPSGDIYMFGGGVGSQLRNDTWSIRISGDSSSDVLVGLEGKPRNMEVTASLVETTGNKPSPRYGHQSALAGGLLIVWGGATSIVNRQLAPSDDDSVYTLNITTHHWTKRDIQPAPSARAGHAACIHGDQFIVFGGWLKPGQHLKDLWRIDLASPPGNLKWEKIELASESQSPPERAWNGMVAYREKLYVFSGANNKTPYNDTWCFDMVTRVWTSLKCTGPIPPPRRYHAVSLVGDAVYMFGGLDKSDNDLGDTWSFKIDEQKWYRFPSMDSQPSARYRHVQTVIDGCVLFVEGIWRGWYEYGYVKRVHILDTDRIDYSEKGDEVTLKSMPLIKQSGSTRLARAPEGDRHAESGVSKGSSQIARAIPFEVLEDRTVGSETDGAGMTGLVAAIDSIRAENIEDDWEVDPLRHKATTVTETRDMISGAMPATEILRYLVVHGCRDVSTDLEISHISEYPVSSGGFGDVYCATLRNGDRVGLKCVRMLVGSSEEGRKFLKENILIADDHTPKLTDFGNAVLSEYTLQFSHSTTTPGMSMRWTAPEIIKGESKSTQMGDIYALGMIIFETMTGLLPFARAKDSTIMFSVASGKIPNRPEEHIPTGVEQADRLWSAMTSCWAFDPHARPKAWEVKNAMDGITSEGLLLSQS
ncbi:unnamed protein product [Rhizoctonia solani]|uniref:Protein kinase domain-containing protein n=1 Tax=Rhizoctonia solani TaxID=456999 RepID=A0A8H3B0F8_9AGAM|nr:unnamed protein product [Rhizoctonia solani]